MERNLRVKLSIFTLSVHEYCKIFYAHYILMMLNTMAQLKHKFNIYLKK